MSDASNVGRFWFRLYEEEDPDLITLLEQYDGATRGRVIRRLLRLGHGVETGNFVAGGEQDVRRSASVDLPAAVNVPDARDGSTFKSGLAVFGLDPSEFSFARD